MSKKTPDPQPDPQTGQQPHPQTGASGSRWEPEPNAPSEQLATPPRPAPAQPDAQPAAAGSAAATTATDVPPPAYPAPVDAVPTSTTFASLKALSTGTKAALAGAAAVLVLGSGVTGFAIGQAGDDQRVDVRFGQGGPDGDGRGGFPGGMPGRGQLPQGQLPQGGAGPFPGQLPQGELQQDGGAVQNDSSPS